MQGNGAIAAARSTLRRLFRPRRSPYAGTDFAGAARLGVLLWLFMSGLVAVLLPLSPPNHPIAGAGWAIAIALVAAGLLVALRMSRQSDRARPDELLGIAYATLLAIAVLEWLAGGHGAPYNQLCVLPLLFTAAVHPPRRVAVYLLAVAACLAAPLVYKSATRGDVGQAVTELLLYAGLALATVLLMEDVRMQRLGLAERGQREAELARRDPLTGLRNRRAFDEALEAETVRARRYGRPLSVLVLDLEQFKDINDRYGHLEGDRCLRDAADALRRAVRAADTSFRWGGDEFAVLLPESSRDDARRVADRIRAAIREARRPDGRPLEVRYGTAELTDEIGVADLLSSADLDLLAAKDLAAGR